MREFEEGGEEKEKVAGEEEESGPRTSDGPDCRATIDAEGRRSPRARTETPIIGATRRAGQQKNQEGKWTKEKKAWEEKSGWRRDCADWTVMHDYV